MPTISACMVLWKSEKVIRKCLENIKGVVDEIIIVHDGPPVDRSLEIAREYTNKIYIRPRIGHGEPHRPFSFKKATKEWILWFDHDELLTPRLKKNIRKLVKRKDVAGYTFLWPVKYGNKNLKKGYFSRNHKLVLFRKNAIVRFYGLPNETVKLNGKIIDTDYWLIHNQEGERRTIRAFLKRDVRSTKLHAKMMIQKKLVTKPAPWYLIKAPLWFVLYLGYYYGIKLAFRTKADISTSFQHALYNLFLYWFVFLGKIGVKLKT